MKLFTGYGVKALCSWLGRWYVCILHRGSYCSLARATDGRIMRGCVISSWQSAATSETVKAPLGMCYRVSSAISSTGPLLVFIMRYQTVPRDVKRRRPRKSAMISIRKFVVLRRTEVWSTRHSRLNGRTNTGIRRMSNYLRRRLASEGNVSLGVTLSRVCVSVSLVSAAKVMRCIQCCLVSICVHQQAECV